MKKYKVYEHGDTLEKAASSFIKNHFTNYEEVWKTYIGNKGNNTMAKIPGYPNDNKRKDFSEYSYTVLESAFIMFNIVQSKIFSSPITKVEEYVEFNKNFISFFAHLGRINDNVINAANELSKNYAKDLAKKIHFLYEARHIVIHGKVIPVSQDDLGLVKIPKFHTDSTNTFDWTFNKSWTEAKLATEEYTEDLVWKYYEEVISILNSAYKNFYNIIIKELKELKTEIKFEYDALTQEPVNVYNIKFPVSSSLHNK